MDIDSIIPFCNFIKVSVDRINTNIRNKIISFKDILYCSLYMNSIPCSYSLANINMGTKEIIDVSDDALKKKRKNTSFQYLKQISDSLIDFIYKDDNDPRVIGVDGTYISLSIKLKSEGFATSRRNTYCIALISSLFDVNKKLLINYSLTSNRNERQGLVDQLEYLKVGDILIMDRGYFSKDLLHTLHKFGIDVIFRMKKNSYLVKQLKYKNQTSMKTRIYYGNKIISFRIIMYNIGNKKYYLGTTIMNKTVSYFKDLYWKRWRIEINFRESKYLLSLRNLMSRNINCIQQDVYSHNILFIIHSYFKNQLNQCLPKEKSINSKI